MIAPRRILGWSIRSIASHLGHASSIISPELCRNSGGTRVYAGYWAYRDAQRRRRIGRHACLASGMLATSVQEKPRCRWSPEQIVYRVRLGDPHTIQMRISYQTIYTWLAADHRTGGSWSRYLRHHHRRRKRDGNGPRATHIMGGGSLADRRVIAHRRGCFGDLGRGSCGRRRFVATHVDRRSRVLLAAKVSRRTAVKVTVATRNLLHPFPPQERQTLIVDNGSEWGTFSCLQRTLGLQVYSVVAVLNKRSRKCLTYQIPAEVFARALGGALQS